MRLAAPSPTTPGSVAATGDPKRPFQALSAEGQDAVLDFLSPPTDEALRTVEEEVFLFDWPVGFLNDQEMALDAVNLYMLLLNPIANVLLPAVMLVVPTVIMRCRGLDALQQNQMMNVFVQQMGKTMSNGGAGALAVGGALLANVATWLFSVWQTWLMTKEHWNHVMQLQRRVQAVGKMAQSVDITKLPKARFTAEVKRWRRGMEWAQWCPFGASLRTYRDIRRNPDIVRALASMYGDVEVEMLPSPPGWTQPTFDPSLDTMADVKALRPPAHLVAETAVCNDVRLGVEKQKTSLHLLTSPNAGGKSTFLKTIGTAVVTSKALNLVPADAFTWRRPIERLDTLLQLRDEAGKASLYQAELAKVARVVKDVQEHRDQTSLVLIDEMFNTTNAREGESAAAGVLRWYLKDCAHTDCCFVVSTHLHGLAKLTDLDGCSPWCITPQRKYVLHPGFTQECVGLEMLRKCMPEAITAYAQQHADSIDRRPNDSDDAPPQDLPDTER